MGNKYYQPNSEDFNIGVECQVYYPREEFWKDRKIRHWGINSVKKYHKITQTYTLVRLCNINHIK